MRNIFVTADTHFYHKNIITKAERPFDSIEEMNEAIISNWNSTVTNNDLIYHLGDFMMGISIKIADESFNKMKELVGRLRGNIRLISGNHDKILTKLCIMKNECPFEIIKPRDFVRTQGKKIRMEHRPINADFLLHGHSHGNMKSRGYIRLDVGVDCWDFAPISLEEAVSKLKVLEHKKHYH
jgi:calcineurin-like phosphoesterase family protein